MLAQVNKAIEWAEKQLQRANATAQSTLLPQVGELIQLAGQAVAPATADIALTVGTAATAYPTLETWLTAASDAATGLGTLLSLSRR